MRASFTKLQTIKYNRRAVVKVAVYKYIIYTYYGTTVVIISDI